MLRDFCFVEQKLKNKTDLTEKRFSLSDFSTFVSGYRLKNSLCTVSQNNTERRRIAACLFARLITDCLAHSITCFQITCFVRWLVSQLTPQCLVHSIACSFQRALPGGLFHCLLPIAWFTAIHHFLCQVACFPACSPLLGSLCRLPPTTCYARCPIPLLAPPLLYAHSIAPRHLHAFLPLLNLPNSLLLIACFALTLCLNPDSSHHGYN